MTAPTPPQLTQLLIRWSEGDKTALDELFPHVYEDLRILARRRMKRERADHTLQTTALVNDAYLRLIDQRRVHWQNRAHFFAVAARIMRRILVDHARRRTSGKRGGSVIKVPLDEATVAMQGRDTRLIALNEALNALAEIDPRRAQVVELRHFGGLTNKEIAEVLKIHPNTVVRAWNMAQAWLYKELSNGESGSTNEP